MALIIFTFHGIGPIPRKIDVGERNCWLDQDMFEAVLDQVRGCPDVRLTFDDGNASDVEIALPALLRSGLSAQFFVCSGRLNQPTFLNAAQLRELRIHGMAIGSHGVTHRSWRDLSPAQLKDELEGSRQVLETLCGIPVDRAACPFGAYDRTVLNGLRRAGYRSVYTSDGGDAKESQWLKARTTVTRSMTLDTVEHLIRQRTAAWDQFQIDLRKLYKRLR